MRSTGPVFGGKSPTQQSKAMCVECAEVKEFSYIRIEDFCKLRRPKVVLSWCGEID